ncbi:hypothetical protein VTO73DRAFT_5046 [Trametes versicolor]
MDTLPLETLQQIFKLACTDGGYTGHTLSLVSKGIRAAARAARFHSISLIASPRHLQLFVALYERECDPALGDKPRIQHLHVAFPVTEHEQLEATSRNGTAVSYASISIANHPGPTTYEDYLGEAQTLFRLITPDLVTLVVQCGFSGAGDLDLPIIEHPFPHLLEVTFVGVAQPLTLVSRLSLPFWFTHAPFVTHLGVSCADDHAAAIASAIGVPVEPEPNPYGMWPFNDDSLDPGAPSTPTTVPGVPAYPTVRHLLLQPGPGPACHMCCCGDAAAAYDSRMQVLREIERGSEVAGVMVVEAKAPEHGLFLRYYEPARRRWLERMNDGRDEAGDWSG